MKTVQQSSIDIIKRVLKNRTSYPRIFIVQIYLIDLESIFDCFYDDEAFVGVSEECLEYCGYMSWKLVPLYEIWIETIQDQNLFVLGCI